MNEMNTVDKVSTALLVVGGLNWGLVGVFKYNLVDELFGVESGVARVVYTVVGLRAVYCLYRMLTMMSKPASKV